MLYAEDDVDAVVAHLEKVQAHPVSDSPKSAKTTANDPAPFKDPQPSVERISQLAHRVLTGDILLPKFQRDFVWPRIKIIGLLDSIARNYPVGSILLWQSKQELASENSIAGLSIADRKPDYPVNYLLDGQQRLSTVCGALYWTPDDDPESLWNIAYDLKAQRFIHLKTLDEPPLHQMPMRLFPNPAKYFQRSAALADVELSARADALFNRFQDYKIAAVTLGDMAIGDIAPIFERINSTATPLTIVDLMRAATWAPEFDLRDAIDGVREELSKRNYGGIDRKTMLRVTSAAAGYGFRIDDIDALRTKDAASLGLIMKSVSLASRRAVDFLSTHIRSPRAQSLPYANQFALLAEIFRQVEKPTALQFQAIEHWFWRTTLSGYFGGWNTGQMSADYAAIADFAQNGKELEVSSALPRAEVWRVTQFRANSAVSKMSALVLAYASPVDLLTGQTIDIGKSLAWNNDKEYHHFFPRNFLKGQGVSAAKANVAANIVMLSSASNIKILDRAPSDYLAELIKEVGRATVVSRLATLRVPESALDAALVDDYSGFLAARSDELQRVAMLLVGESAVDSASRPPAIASSPDEVLVGDTDEDAGTDLLEETIDRSED